MKLSNKQLAALVRKISSETFLQRENKIKDFIKNKNKNFSKEFLKDVEKVININREIKNLYKEQSLLEDKFQEEIGYNSRSLLQSNTIEEFLEQWIRKTNKFASIKPSEIEDVILIESIENEDIDSLVSKVIDKLNGKN